MSWAGPVGVSLLSNATDAGHAHQSLVAMNH